MKASIVKSGVRQRVSGVLAAAWAALLLSASPAGAQSAMPAQLAGAWAQSKLPESSLSLVIQEIGGPRLVDINGTQPRNPASVMKLVTTYAAISQLGPDYVWRTDFLTTAGRLANAQGVLAGPLYLRAGGDPLLMLQDLWRLMRDLRLRGIREISDIVIDRSLFADVTIDPSAFDGAADRPYNASPDTFMVGLGAVRLVFTPDPATRTWRSFVDPPVPGIQVDGNIEWSDATCVGSPGVTTETTLVGGNVRFRVSGKVAASCGEFDMFRLAFSQQEFAARVLRTMWLDLGGTLTGEVRSGSIPADAVAIASHESPSLSEVIRLINKRSNNVMTRVLLLTLGAEAGQRPATVESSARVATAVLARQGLEMRGMVLDNGSGLSRVGVVSADSLTQMLTKAWQSPVMPEYISSLAILGVDGSLRSRMRDGANRSRAHLKTGGLRDVRSIAGYVWGTSGKRYIVVSIVNHDRAHDARAFENALIAWLIAH